MPLNFLTIISIFIITAKSEVRRLSQDSSCATTPSPSTLTCDPNRGTTFAYAWGDPHWRTFTNWHHHFQGDIPLFYYLMTPCIAKGYGHDKVTGLPWNLVAKEIGSTGNSVKQIHEMILESIDEDGNMIYYLYVRNWGSRIVGYYTRNINDQDIITIEEAMQQQTWVNYDPLGNHNINLGIGRTANVFYQSGWIYVQFRINGGCTNDNSIVLDYRYSGNRVEVQLPPICYRCATCGLLGDFYEPNGKLLNPNGKHCNVLNSYIYQNLGYMEATTVTPEPTQSPVAPPPGTTQFGSPIDCASDAATKARVQDAVDTARQQYVQQRNCCLGTTCNSQITAAINDVCAAFQGTHVTDTDLAAKAYKITSEALEVECLNHNSCAGHDDDKYVYIDEQKKWDDARDYCKDTCGTSLAIIQSATDNTKAISKCQGSSTRKCWLGLRRQATDTSKWHWHEWKNNGWINRILHSNGYDFTDWRQGEPDNVAEHCTILDNDKWIDKECLAGSNRGIGPGGGFLCMNAHYTGTSANEVNNNIDNDDNDNMNAGKRRNPRQRPRQQPRNQGKKGGRKGNRKNNAINVETVKDNNNNTYFTGSLMMKWFLIGLSFGIILTFCIGGPLNMLYKAINNKKHSYKPVMEISSSDQSDDDTKNIL